MNGIEALILWIGFYFIFSIWLKITPKDKKIWYYIQVIIGLIILILAYVNLFMKYSWFKNG